jgi:hypothetical protein
MQTITFQGKEHLSAHDAVVELNFSGDHAISIGGRFFTITDAEYQRLIEAGTKLTTWHHHERTQLLISVPGT